MMPRESRAGDIGDSSSPRALLADCSLEITARDAAALDEVRADLPSGTQVSITYLPGDSIEKLIDAAARVRGAGFEPVPHISARRLSSLSELQRFLSGLASGAGIDRLFVIGGDPAQPAGPFSSALDVIQSGFLEDFGIRKVGIAGYPEGHPQLTQEVLRRAMSDKLEALTRRDMDAEIVTQFVFDADHVLGWLTALRADGIDAQVRIGVPGPASIKSLLRFASRCGVSASTKVLAKYGISLTRLLGTATPDILVEALAQGLSESAHGGVTTHLYPFGGVAQSASWLAGHLRDGARPEKLRPR
ncbi:methylenetetrahydrofolate reductase [Sphingomonas sp. Root710]|uniref:methylenetetrahydrofolate reductase n=1 Tax=Sphingomonas sp. Root710 TaxID=1736594 RepID=UPI001F3638E5|nr:methylenetetrahydrofolate reductase [Sphingomonas sp. Root710]